jgi:hypothetical protein
MSVRQRSIQKSLPFDNPPANKPLGKIQLYLIELKTTIVLLREVLVEVKELAVIIALIAFFIWGALQLFEKLH